MTYLTTFNTKDSGNGYAIINAPNANIATSVCKHLSRFNDLPDFKIESIEEFHTHPNCETGIIAEGITSAPESLYDIAVRLGFKGTESQFIESLVGKQGPKGDLGILGEQGKSFTYDMFTVEQLKLLKGPKGDPGIKGDKGDPGLTDLEYNSLIESLNNLNNAVEDANNFVNYQEKRIDDIKGNFNLWYSDVKLKYTENLKNILEAIDKANTAIGPKGDKGDIGDKGDLGIKGEDGVGIESIVQSKISSDSDGLNVIKVTLTNGSVQSFSYRNGEKGEKGEKGNDGSVSFNDLTPELKEQLKGESIYMTSSINEEGHLIMLIDESKSTPNLNIQNKHLIIEL